MDAITVENVSKRYGTVTALDRVDLTVEEGEIFGFLGPNGAGKSTLINVFLDFVQPDDGRATIFGHDCQEEDVAAKSRMGVLPDGYTVYDRLTGRQHVEYAIDDARSDRSRWIESRRIRSASAKECKDLRNSYTSNRT